MKQEASPALKAPCVEPAYGFDPANPKGVQTAKDASDKAHSRGTEPKLKPTDEEHTAANGRKDEEQALTDLGAAYFHPGLPMRTHHPRETENKSARPEDAGASCDQGRIAFRFIRHFATSVNTIPT